MEKLGFTDSSIIDGEGKAVPLSTLKNKLIGLYFSASWCPPCRSFTPQLDKKYKEIISGGYNFEIIFISADNDEDEAREYFSHMSFKMLKFDENQLNEDLSAKYGVTGIPCLVLLDENCDIITTNGSSMLFQEGGGLFKEGSVEAAKAAAKKEREDEEAAARRVAELKENPLLESAFALAGAVIKDKNGDAVELSSLQGKVVGLYFSAHWCSPCRRFTPKLAARYEELIAMGKAVDIIFISFDREESSFDEYYADMPWKCLVYDDRSTAQMLGEAMDVSGIPSLKLFIDGKLLAGEDHIEAIFNCFPEDILNYKEKLAVEEAKLEMHIQAMPATLRSSLHEHELKKMQSCYNGGSFGCDGCQNGGKGWVYHCEECGFDLHPMCAQETCN